MFEVAHDERTKDFRNVGDVLHDEIDKWQKLSAGKQSLTGTPSGFADLDEITGGFQPGNLIIIAARPSMGKSALVTNMAENVALHKTSRGPSRCSASRCPRPSSPSASSPARRRSRATTCARAG